MSEMEDGVEILLCFMYVGRMWVCVLMSACVHTCASGVCVPMHVNVCVSIWRSKAPPFNDSLISHLLY